MSEKEDAVYEMLLDFANAMESACVNLKHYVAERKGLKAEEQPKFSWNPNSIKWEKAEGTKGEYERSEDVNNLEFKALLKDLAEHNGFLFRDGFNYWVFKNGSTVGRKRR